MRSSILWFIAFFPILCSSQSFIVTPDGLKNSSDVDKSFIIINIDNKTAEELYNTTVRYINEQMTNPESSIKSSIKGDYIRYSMYVPEIIRYSNSGSKRKIQAYFDIEFRFKDNRIRYEITSIRMPDKDSKNEVVFSGSKWTSYPIFEKNGKLFKENEKNNIEAFFNTLLSNYISYISEGSSKDDW